MKLSVQNLVGEYCLTFEDGETVFNLIHSELSARRTVELDFIGVNVFASPFFNGAIGRLLKDIPPEVLNQFLVITNLSPTGQAVLVRVIENSKQYHFDEKARQAIDDILSEPLESGR